LRPAWAKRERPHLEKQVRYSVSLDNPSSEGELQGKASRQQKLETLPINITIAKRTGGIAQAIENLQREALSSSTSASKKREREPSEYLSKFH
jgi:hypothetical protein